MIHNSKDGMAIGVRKMRERVEILMNEALKNGIDADRKEAFEGWIESMNK